MAAWKRLCCPVDFSYESRAAMEEAAELAWRFGGDLTLVHVDDRPRVPVETLASRERREQRTVELERILAVWCDEAAMIATAKVDHVLLAGAPAEEIGRFVRERGVDVVVLGTGGRAGRERGSLGSVTQSVVREAPCTVVVVRGSGPRPAGRAPPG